MFGFKGWVLLLVFPKADERKGDVKVKFIIFEQNLVPFNVLYEKVSRYVEVLLVQEMFNYIWISFKLVIFRCICIYTFWCRMSRYINLSIKKYMITFEKITSSFIFYSRVHLWRNEWRLSRKLLFQIFFNIIKNKRDIQGNIYRTLFLYHIYA